MSPREAGAARRRRGLRAYCAAVLAWTVSFMTALVLLPPSAHTIAAAHADSTSVTVAGPQAWSPQTQAFGARGTVSVTQTQNLIDQTIHVSWAGLTPSNGPAFINIQGGSGWNTTLYPVIVLECRGANPQITDCYGSPLYDADPTKGFMQPADGNGLAAPDFPTNMQAAATHADGTGGVDIEVYTSNQSPTMGCDATHQCSIVVLPMYGGDPQGLNGKAPDCTNHTLDRRLDSAATGYGINLSDTTAAHNATGASCAWNNHVAVPLSFAPVAGDCPAGPTSVAAEGQPMLDRALAQWTIGACLNSANPITLQYSSDLTEPEARNDFLAGNAGADMAFTTLPADPSAVSARPYTYVPVGSTGIAITYLIDNPVTHLPITGLKLNARLIAKLLTQSYDVEYVSGWQSDTPSVAKNPTCLFSDPEFQALNPTGSGVFYPNCASNEAGLYALPIVTGGSTDLVHELTAWIMSDPDAKAFLSGAPDPWGMHVDPFYKTSVYPYPVDTFVTQDSSGPPIDPTTGQAWDPSLTGTDHYGPQMKSYEWNPLQAGLDAVLRQAVQSTPTCQDWRYNQTSATNPKCTAQNVGARSTIAIMDTGRAAAFNLPTAALPNGTGAYVTPNAPSMASAALDYVTDSATGTQSLPWGSSHTGYSGDTVAYPLTVPNYAMAPTSGLSAAKESNIADLLSAVTDSRSGQLPGTAPGDLAPGYVGDTPGQASQAGAAIAKIRAGANPNPTSTVTATAPGQPTTSGNQVVTPVTVSKNGTTSLSYLTSTIGSGGGGNGLTGSNGSSSKGAVGAPDSNGPTHSISGSTAAAATVGTASADTAGVGRLILPILLIIGLVLVAAGPIALMVSSGTVGAKIRSAWSRPSRRFGR